MSQPIPVMVRRHKCPHCGQTRANRAAAAAHIDRCWANPAARGCKTCRHFSSGDSADYATGYPGFDESCDQGVDLSGRPACEHCGGVGEVFHPPTGGVSECGYCAGDGAEVKPGPIVGCHEWEARR